MSDPSAANMMESTLLSQCLDFSKQLISKFPFKFEVSFASGFSSKINNFMDKEITNPEEKRSGRNLPPIYAEMRLGRGSLWKRRKTLILFQNFLQEFLNVTNVATKQAALFL